MAKISKWALFMRAFLVTLIVGQPARVGSQGAGEEADWQRALNENTAAAFYRYLSDHPAGRYAGDALRQLQALGALQDNAPGRQIPSLNGGNRGVGETRRFEPADNDSPAGGGARGGVY